MTALGLLFPFFFVALGVEGDSEVLFVKEFAGC